MDNIIFKDSPPASPEENACLEDGGSPHYGEISVPNSPDQSSIASPQIKRKKMAENNVADTTGEASASRQPVGNETSSLVSSSNSNNITSSVIPSDKVFGFIGLGIMGSGIVKRLLNSGHQVHVWDRDPEKCQEFARIGAIPEMSPSHVVGSADVTFSCVSDSKVVKDLVFRQDGVLSKMNASKAYVEMTSIDPETSVLIAGAIQEYGGRYLETMLIGSKGELEKGRLINLVAGDKTVFKDANSCFEAIAAVSIFFGDVGDAIRMNLMHQMCMGTTIASIAESMALADRAGLNQDVFMEILGMSSLCSPLLMEKGKAIANRDFSTKFPLTHLTKDMRLVLGLADPLDQRVRLTSAASEVFLRARKSGFSNLDASAIYLSARY